VTTYGRSPWIDQFPKSRIPEFPRYRGAALADVVVVGGGLTGCLTAYALAVAGEKTILLEADRIGQGAAGSAAGWIAPDPNLPLARLELAVGRRQARAAWQAWRRAALDFAALLRRLQIKCALESHSAALIARTADDAARLKQERKARVDAGLEAALLTTRAIRADFGLDAVAALRSREGAAIDPYRAVLGIAAGAAERGARLFERSPVRRIAFDRKIADVHTAAGAIRTRRVIVATGVPTALVKGLARHFWFKSTFLVLTMPVPARIRQMLGTREAVVSDVADPPHTIRWVGDRLLVTGADAAGVPPRLRDKVVVQRTGQLMYELSTLYPDISGILPEYGWMADYALSAEGLPYIGVHRNYPHQLFAFGDSSRSVTGSYLASRMLVRQHFDEPDPVDEAFSFNR
jgi:glycine/D-amino acid oxidase-like deaminating enzyme